MANLYGPRITTENLILNLDAGNTKSYPGSGTVWYDLSGNNNNFNIVSTAFKNNSGGKYMDFNGSYGCAKRSPDITLSDSTGVTYIVWTRVLNSTSNWRTLTRSFVSDHHVIIQSGGWNIGMYDNGGGGFRNSGFSQQNLPNYGTTNWICMHWRFNNTSPYYKFSYNDTPGTTRGSLTTATYNRYERGFGSIGAYHNGSTSPSSASQFWGDIAVFQCYNRSLEDEEILQNYNALRGRFGL